MEKESQMRQPVRWTLMIVVALLVVPAGAEPLSGTPWTPGYLAWTADAEPAPESARGEFTVEIWHNAPVANALTIYLQGPSGMPIRLGRIAPSGIETFTVPANLGAGDYRLTAQTADGRWIRSLPFSPFESDGVRWDVDRNRLSMVWNRN